MAQPVHVALVSRGAAPGGHHAALRTMSNVLAWARHPERLRFHLLAEEQGLLRSGVAVLAANAGLPLSVVNATDAAMVARLPPLGLSMLRHPALQGKPRLYTTPKLFLFALLDVPMALVLDTDVLVMADVCDAWDAFAARAAREPRMLFSYAREQQPGCARDEGSNCELALHCHPTRCPSRVQIGC